MVVSPPAVADAGACQSSGTEATWFWTGTASGQFGKTTKSERVAQLAKSKLGAPERGKAGRRFVLR